MRNNAVLLLISLAILSFTLPISIADSLESKKVLWVEINDFISTASVEHFSAAIEEVKRGKYTAILLTLDTFGGSADAMFNIFDLILNSPVPVIGYVYPPGKQALSAGTLILMATDFAAMANYTTIGSAQPVLGITPINESKTINAIVGKMVTFAQLHNRNKTQIARFITHNDNLTPEQALRYKVIEAVAFTPQELLKIAHGKKVRMLKGEVTLDTDGELVKFEPSIRVMILRVLSDPLVSSLLTGIGFLTLIIGLTSPGVGIEIAAGIMILLGLIGQGFNVNISAIILLVVGSGLLIYELHNPGFGIAGIGGIILLGLGMALLVTNPTTPTLVSQQYAEEALRIIIASLSVVGGFFAFAIYKVIKIRKAKRALELIPMGSGRAVDDINEENIGYVVVEGEYWRARSAKGKIKAGTRIKVVKRDGRILVVERES
jgi:membrane-bound serine protease (ClpP class)